MTFPIRPVSPISATQRSMRTRQDPELAAAAMEKKPSEATALLGELLDRIENEGSRPGVSHFIDPAAEASAQLSRVVESASNGPPPSRESFARQLIYVGEVEKNLREQLGAARTDEKREELREALQTLVKVKRFRGD
ncbi:hypothetical protein [Stenotrophomonas sp. VV52]|uniref:hypothetical protein n=1 Tax=Stenotrophomonas sp. VV52 TaxID=2066958 RepID=UPI0011AF70D7|nr:hypothetical protein [Stenotrophomonas sp. VV52]